MTIDLRNYNISPKSAFRMAGYTYRKEKNDFIRELKDESGRFHLLLQEKNIYQIHFDLYVEWRHVSFPMPLLIKKERGRIGKIISKFKRKEQIYGKHYKNTIRLSKTR